MSLFHLIYVVTKLPFEEHLDNKIEIFNESCILLLLTILTGYAANEANPQANFNWGFFVISIIMLIIAVNVIIFLIINAKLIFEKALKPCVKKIR